LIFFDKPLDYDNSLYLDLNSEISCIVYSRENASFIHLQDVSAEDCCYHPRFHFHGANMSVTHNGNFVDINFLYNESKIVLKITESMYIFRFCFSEIFKFKLLLSSRM